MSDFGARLRNNLEPVLAMADPREKISAYHDMPYAIFHYDPEQELPLRREVSSLQTRLENKGKRITRISLAECLEAALKSEATLEEWFENERTFGAEKAIEDVHKLLADRVPLVDLVADRMPARSRSAKGRRLHRPDGGAVPGLPDVLAAGAAQGARRRADGALLSGRPRWRRGAPIHGRAPGRAQLSPEDFLRNSRQ